MTYSDINHNPRTGKTKTTAKLCKNKRYSSHNNNNSSNDDEDDEALAPCKLVTRPPQPATTPTTTNASKKMPEQVGAVYQPQPDYITWLVLTLKKFKSLHSCLLTKEVRQISSLDTASASAASSKQHQPVERRAAVSATTAQSAIITMSKPWWDTER